MNRKIGNVLLQQVSDPSFHLSHFCVADPCFDADWQPTCFCRFNQLSRHIGTQDQAAAFAATGNIWDRTPHIDIDPFKSHFRHSNTHLPEKFRLVSPNMGDDRLLVFCECQSTTNTLDPIWMAVTI